VPFSSRIAAVEAICGDPDHMSCHLRIEPAYAIAPDREIRWVERVRLDELQ
jgi:hypothetical protein